MIAAACLQSSLVKSVNLGMARRLESDMHRRRFPPASDHEAGFGNAIKRAFLIGIERAQTECCQHMVLEGARARHIAHHDIDVIDHALIATGAAAAAA